jgi:hypothetical protein
MNLNPEQAARMAAVLKKAGIRIEGLKAISPWSINTPRSRSVQIAIEALDPRLANELRGDSHTPSLELVAAQAADDFDPTRLSPAAQQEWASLFPDAAAERAHAAERALLADWEVKAEALRASQQASGTAPSDEASARGRAAALNNPRWSAAMGDYQTTLGQRSVRFGAE